MDEGHRNPWDRLPNETPKAWQAFLIFRDLGVARTSADVARQLGKSTELLRRWKKQWDWERRATAWDQHLAGERDHAWLEAFTAAPEALAEMNRRHVAAVQEMQQRALLRLASVDPSDLSVGHAWQYLQEAIRLERLVFAQLPDAPKGEEADQDTVVALLADPETRRLAAQLAEKAGHGQVAEGAA